ncbi:MAG: hypothetical protein IID46_04975 [Planctomycetes bacterium]|nr:hypothetical protein [Planctomycetota bacterium]
MAAIGKHEEAEKMFRKCLDMWKVLIDEIPKNPQSLREQAKSRNWLAWFLVTCPEIKRRNPSQAVRLAKQVVKQESDEPVYWNTLALAHYRAGDWKNAKTAVDRALKEAGNEPSEMNWLIQAMVLKQQNAAAQAKTAYDKALGQRARKSKEKKRIGRIEAESLSTVRQAAAALFSRRG